MLFFAFALNRRRGRGKGPIFTAVRPAVNVADGGQADGHGRTASLARSYVRARAGGREVDGQSTFLHPPQTRTKQWKRGNGARRGGTRRDVGGSEQRAPRAAAIANDIMELRAHFPPRSLSPFVIQRRVCLIVVRRGADLSVGCRMHYRIRLRLRRSVDRPPAPSRPRERREGKEGPDRAK